MMWNGYGMGGMWWIWLWGLLVLAGIIFLVVVTAVDLRGRNRRLPQSRLDSEAPGPLDPSARRNSRDLLDERYARGELTTEEYRERIQTLADDAR